MNLWSYDKDLKYFQLFWSGGVDNTRWKKSSPIRCLFSWVETGLKFKFIPWSASSSRPILKPRWDTIPALLANRTGLHFSLSPQFPTKQTPFSSIAIWHRFSRQQSTVQFSMLSIPDISVKFPASRPPWIAWFSRICFPEQRVCLISLAVWSSIPRNRSFWLVSSN